MLETVKAELVKLNCPSKESDLEKLNEDFLKEHSNSIEHVHEYIKMKHKFFAEKDSKKLESLAVQALTNDPNKASKINQAENLHRLLIKLGSDGESFKAKAKETYKYGRYFKK